MNQVPVIRTSCLVKTAIACTLAIALISAPTISYAGIVCEQGPIAAIQMRSGGKSAVQVSTGGGVNTVSARQHIDGKYFTTIEAGGNEVRWRDRLSLLKLAYALQTPVKITANDGSDCDGLTDEFAVSLCGPGKC